MLRPLTVDVARTLPTEAGLVDPAPQRAGTDHNALCVQMCGEQWHGPGVGVIPELARVAREQLTELVVRQGRRRARTTGSFAISQRRWRSFGKIALDPAIDRAALNTRMPGDDGNRLAFCNLGNCPKAPIKSGVMRLLKRSQQTSTLRPTERRIARSGCVHPDTIGSACACRKTSGNLLKAARRPAKCSSRASAETDPMPPTAPVRPAEAGSGGGCPHRYRRHPLHGVSG